MNNKNYVVGVDFGSSNLVMAVGTLDTTGEIKVEALLSRPSNGVEMGVIQNVNNVCDVLRDMKHEIEEELGIRIESAYASVSGAFIHCHSYFDHVFVGDRVNGIVSQADVDALNDRMNRVTVQDDETVMDRFPLNYMIDNRRETKNPVGAFSRQLSSNFAFVIGKRQPLSRIEMVFRNAGIALSGIFANSAIAAEAVLGFDEKNDGAAVVDIGADTTDVSVYSGGIVRYAATIPVGGRAIDNDINKHGVPMRNAEDLKKECGTAVADEVPENKAIKIQTSGHGFKTVMKRNLASIIEARLMDIIEYVQGEIKDAGYESKLPYGVVLTGGSALIPQIDQLFAKHTGMEVRVATATEGLDAASRAKVDSPEYTAVISLLLSGAAKGGSAVSAEENAVGQRVPTVSAESGKSGEAAPRTELEFPKQGGYVHRPSTAKTYEPPKREAPKAPETPANRPAAAVTTPVAPAAPVGKETEPATVEPVQTPVAEEPVDVQTPGQPKNKRGLMGRFMNTLNDIFQSGGEDPSLDITAGEAPRKEPKLKPKSKADLADFFVDGEDKEEI